MFILRYRGEITSKTRQRTRSEYCNHLFKNLVQFNLLKFSPYWEEKNFAFNYVSEENSTIKNCPNKDSKKTWKWSNAVYNTPLYSWLISKTIRVFDLKMEVHKSQINKDKLNLHIKFRRNLCKTFTSREHNGITSGIPHVTWFPAKI